MQASRQKVFKVLKENNVNQQKIIISKAKVKYFLRHTKIGRIYTQQSHITRNVTESPSGTREILPAKNRDLHIRMKW